MKRFLIFLLFVCSNAFGGITDLKLSTAQIFDVQWYISGGRLNASGFSYIYASVNYDTQTNSAARWTAAQTADASANGRYIGFFNSTTNPGTYGMAVFNSNGTRYKTINNTGSFRALADGAIFYNGNGMWGTLITTGQGYNNGQNGNWAVTQDNPNNTQLQAYTPPSSTPLSAGQTAAPPPPAYGTNFTRVTSYEWKTYTAGSQPLPSEQAHEAFDNTNGSKWFGLRSQGAWAVVQFVTDGTYSSTRAVQKIQFVTANDVSGRDPTGFKVWGSINGIDWVLISQQAISLPTGRHTESTVYSLNNVTAFSYYKVEFTGARDDGDAFQVAEIRLIYDVDDPQGTKAGGGIYTPPPLCCGGSAAAFSANPANTAKVLTFVNRTTADSQVHIEQIGTQNVVEINQSGTRNNYVEYYGNGLSNDINIAQTGNVSTQANYVDLRVVGNFNSVDLQQTSTGGTKGIFADVSGNNNSLLVQQKDGGSHYAEITLSGGNKNVDVLQQGSASHMAKVNLSGTPTDLSLTQSGSTQNYYSITHNCTTAGGCAKITVTQGQ
jgi:hypothetical protein